MSNGYGLPRIKVGQCIRLRIRVIAAFRGAQAVVHEEMRKSPIGKELGLGEYKPHYDYLHLRVTKVERKQITGTNMEIFEEEVFKIEGHFPAEYHLTHPDVFWGFDEVKILTVEETFEFVAAKQKRLDQKVEDARIEADKFKRGVQKVLRGIKRPKPDIKKIAA
jgi:hypothetical protein